MGGAVQTVRTMPDLRFSEISSLCKLSNRTVGVFIRSLQKARYIDPGEISRCIFSESLEGSQPKRHTSYAVKTIAPLLQDGDNSETICSR
jgi:hypothetical protein